MTSLHSALKNYLILRRSLGFKLEEDGAELSKFVSFLTERKAPFITTSLALAWAQCGGGVRPPRKAAWRLAIVRKFATHVAAFDARTEIPPSGLLSVRAVRPRPYIYTDKELKSLLAASREWPDQPRGTYYCLFGLLAVSGLRLGEARGLASNDVDLSNGILTIRRAKFGKCRLVPIHPTTVAVLRQYRKRRDTIRGSNPSTYFFITRKGTQLPECYVEKVFRSLLAKIGIRKLTASSGPRIHDLRHRFAVRTLIDWYRSGKDVESRLPFLSTFLGHVGLRDTYWYLTEYPELMKLAVERLNSRWEEQL